MPREAHSHNTTHVVEAELENIQGSFFAANNHGSPKTFLKDYGMSFWGWQLYDCGSKTTNM